MSESGFWAYQTFYLDIDFFLRELRPYKQTMDTWFIGSLENLPDRGR